jgi:Na+/melibiose symporter-like transporter
MAEPELVYKESIGDLLRGILTDVRTLIREEIALARVEIRQQVGHMKSAAFGIGIAAAALAGGGMLLLVGLSIGLADMLDWPVWAGFLLMAGMLGVIGFVMLALARKEMHQVQAVPQETVSTLKENSAWIAKRLSSARR